MGSTNQKKVQFALSTRAVCLCLRFFESFLHRQAKELFNYWQKPTQTRVKKGQKQGNFGSLFCSLFSISFFHMLWHKSTACFVEAFLCMEENRITCFFAAHTYLCAGKAMHWFSLCVQMKQGAMNPLCRNA